MGTLRGHIHRFLHLSNDGALRFCRPSLKTEFTFYHVHVYHSSISVVRASELGPQGIGRANSDYLHENKDSAAILTVI